MYQPLWRRVARALVQVLACLAHWDARPAGGGADVGDRRVHGVLPEVVGLPRGDLIQQVRFGPAVDGCCGQDCVLELRVLPSAEGRTRAGTARAVPPGAAARPGWPRTTPARPRRGEGTPRRGTCRFAGAGAQARSAPRRCQRRGRARRAGHDGQSWRPRQSAASCRACHDGRPEPSTAGGLCGRQPGTETMQRGETAPSSRWVVTFELRDAREPPFGTFAGAGTGQS